MTSLRVLGLAVVAALALMASAGASTASATTLCSANEEELCESPYGEGTPVEATLAGGSKAVLTVEGNLLQASCSNSTITGETVAEEGDPLPAEISSMTFGSCSGTYCQSIAALHTPYQADFVSNGEAKGTMTTSDGGSGDPALQLKCGGLSCNYDAAGIKFAVEGGSPAQAVLSEAHLEQPSGSPEGCPANAWLSATYDVTSPEPLFVVGKAQRTALCAEVEGDVCSGEVQSAGTQFKIQVEPKTQLELRWPGIWIGYCKELTMYGETSEESGEPLVGEITQAYFGCIGPAIGLPWKVEFSRTNAGNGMMRITSFGGSEIGWVEPGPYPNTCQFHAKNIELDLEGGSPAKLVAAEEPFNRDCGSQHQGWKLTGTLNFSTPDPLFLGEMW